MAARILRPRVAAQFGGPIWRPGSGQPDEEGQPCGQEWHPHGPVAHVAEDGRIHPLEEHLRETAWLAGEFAAVFGGGEWGRVAGVWRK